MINGHWDGTMGIGMGMGMGIGIGMGIGTMGWDNGHWDGMGWDGIGMGLGFNELWAASIRGTICTTSFIASIVTKSYNSFNFT